MIESPLIQEVIAEARVAERVRVILHALRVRFGAVTPTAMAGLEQVKEYEKLLRLTEHVLACPSLQVFEERLREVLLGSPSDKRTLPRPSS